MRMKNPRFSLDGDTGPEKNIPGAPTLIHNKQKDGLRENLREDFPGRGKCRAPQRLDKQSLKCRQEVDTPPGKTGSGRIPLLRAQAKPSPLSLKDNALLLAFGSKTS